MAAILRMEELRVSYDVPNIINLHSTYKPTHMKRRQATSVLIRSAIILIIVSICVTQSKLSATGRREKTPSNFFEDDKDPAKKEKALKAQNVVKVYPDAIRKAMHVVAKQNNEKEIDFLVFDINGNMVLDYKMKSGEKKTISDLKKGSYMYHVFCEDEYISTGKIEFR